MFVLCYTNILKAHNIITTGNNKGGLTLWQHYKK